MGSGEKPNWKKEPKRIADKLPKKFLRIFLDINGLLFDSCWSLFLKNKFDDS
jgi:hypothetical protein